MHITTLGASSARQANPKTATTSSSCYPVAKDAFLGMLIVLIGSPLGASDLIKLHISARTEARSCLWILCSIFLLIVFSISCQSVHPLYLAAPMKVLSPTKCSAAACLASHYQLVKVSATVANHTECQRVYSLLWVSYRPCVFVCLWIQQFRVFFALLYQLNYWSNKKYSKNNNETALSQFSFFFLYFLSFFSFATGIY